MWSSQKEERLLRDPVGQANSVAVLLAHFGVGVPRDVKLAALHSGRRIFVALLHRCDFWAAASSSVGTDHANSTDAAPAAFRRWAVMCFRRFFDSVLGLILDDSPALANLAFVTALTFAKERQGILKLVGGTDPVDTLVGFLAAMPRLQDLMHNIVRTEMLFCDNMLLPSLGAVGRVAVAAQCGSSPEIASGMNATLTGLLSSIDMLPDAISSPRRHASSVVTEGGRSLSSEADGIDGHSGGDGDDSGGDRENHSDYADSAISGLSHMDEVVIVPERYAFQARQRYRKAFEAAWLACLKLPMHPQTHKRVLLRLPEKVIPHFPRPAQLVDFLVDSSLHGGLTSVLAFSGLFVLIRCHKLDYPGFYGNLFQLLQPSFFYAKHRARYFRLLALCLGASALPENVAAAFLKK